MSLEKTIELAAWILAASFGVYRFSRLIPGAEEGPFSVIKKIHTWATKRQDSWLGRGLLCYFCTSFWLSFAVVFLIPLPGSFGIKEFVLIGGAISGISIYILGQKG